MVRTHVHLGRTNGRAADARASAVVVAVLVIAALLGGWAGAQTPGAELPPLGEDQTGQPASAEVGTSAGSLAGSSDGMVSGEAVVELADFICGCLNEDGTVPEWAQVRTVDGQLRRLSAAETFALLARTVDLWNSSGELPAAVPLGPEDVYPPQIDAEDVPTGDYDPESGREIATQGFLDWCGDTVYWIDRLYTIPTAVWINGERFSAAEYLGGLAICIQYAYYEGELLDYVFLAKYAPPQSWVKAYQAEAEAPPQGEEAGVEVGSSEEEEVGQAVVEPEEYPNPTLAVIPEPGKTVSGVVEVMAVYLGPPASFVMIGVDGKTRRIMNSPPYSYRWDTTAESPGSHTVRVRVFGEEETPLVDQASVYTVVAPPPAAEGK